jgi:hypothetical protein
LGVQAGQTQSTAALGSPTVVDNFLFSGLYRYQFSLGSMFGYTMQFTASATGASNGNVFSLITLTDPDVVSAITNDALLDTSKIPALVNHLVPGTGASVELARVTYTAAGTYTFNIDLDKITPITTTANYYTGGWNGSLLLWLYTSTAATSTWTNPVLTAGVYLDRPGQDTGRSGAPYGSRVSRCPVTGFAISRQEMVVDGYRGVKVHPMAYDPEDPDDPIFTDYPEED